MPSRKSNSPAAYQDVKFVLDMAIEKPGLQYILKSPGAATNFKQRCNKYRSIIREMAAETLQHMPGMRAETAYDPLVIRQVNSDLTPDRQGCILLFEHQQVEGRLLDPETGKEIEIPGISNILKD